MTIRKDNIAWPTIYIYITLLFLWIGAVLIGTGYFGNDKAYNICSLEKPKSIKSVLVTIVTLAICTFCCYGQFTVIHDASHNAIASKNPFINHLFGWLSQIFLGPLSDFYAFKYMHLTHHRFTNNITIDPDMWASAYGPGGKWLMPLRWLTIDFAYIINYLPIVIPFYPGKTLIDNHGAVKRVNSNIKMAIFWIYKIMTIFFIYFMAKHGYGHDMVQYWILPSILGKSLLVYAFDYLPHEPHRITLQENPYQTTSYLSMPPKLNKIISIFMFYQNYHIAHHLNPQIPFYKYKLQWLEQRFDWINTKNINIRRLFTMFGEELLPIKDN